MRRVHLLVVLAMLAGGLPASPAAHEIPRSVTVHAFIKVEGNRLRLLVRVPLAAMRDIDFPERDGFLDVTRVEPALRGAVTQWILPGLEIFEEGDRLPAPAIVSARVSLPSDRSFGSYDAALAHVRAVPGAAEAGLPRDQAVLDSMIDYGVTSQNSAFAIRPGFERLGVEVATSLRFVTAAGAVRAFEIRGDPGVVKLDPRWHEAAWRFVELGIFHILGGTDHLLFLLCLVIPLRRLRPLIVVITAFTAAHSITLIASALGLAPGALWFPTLVETLIAASIVYLAVENIVSTGASARRWLVAFGFGLVHGFGFSFVLRDTMQFAGSHLLASLLSFNAGVEIGQFLVLVILVPALQALFRAGMRERIATIVLCAFVAHTAWHWMADRWNALRQFPAPSLDAGALITAVRLLLAVVAFAAIVWLARLRPWRRTSAETLRASARQARAPSPEPRKNLR